MIPVRSFTQSGIEAFTRWLSSAVAGNTPDALTSDLSLSNSLGECSIDPAKKFVSRYDFGCYLADVFSGRDPDTLLVPELDGMWAWISGVYFRQLAPKIRRSEHYIPIRRGSAGSLLHRNAARTAFELVSVHGQNARFALQQPIYTHGQLLESLSASQTVARNKGFFAAAARMYLDLDGRLKKGATSKPKPPRDRKPGEDTGRGSIRRLPTALKRLDLTYDVAVLAPDELIAMLPREYSRWTRVPLTLV